MIHKGDNGYMWRFKLSLCVVLRSKVPRVLKNLCARYRMLLFVSSASYYVSSPYPFPSSFSPPLWCLLYLADRVVIARITTCSCGFYYPPGSTPYFVSAEGALKATVDVIVAVDLLCTQRSSLCVMVTIVDQNSIPSHQSC